MSAARSRPRVASTVTAAVSSLLALQGCADPADRYVTAQGPELAVDGEPFRFVGFNLYDAAATDRYSCSPETAMTDSELAETLTRARRESGATVVRFWAYQPYTDAGRDWTGIDRVIAAAREAGMRVLPVLEDGPGNCTTDPSQQPKSHFEGDTWYSSGYLRPHGTATLSYRDYVAKVVEHYANEPTILGWTMVNEADTSARTDDGQTVLVDFARDIGGLIASLDPNHLVTLGTQSNGAPGASGPDFAAVYGLEEIDFAEVHDWGYWGDDSSAMPGSTDGSTPPDPVSPACMATDAPIACSFGWAQRLDKPLVVGEAGITGRSPAEKRRRATQLSAKMDAAFEAGADGYLVWHLNTRDTDGYDVVLNDPDPLLAVMRRQAEAL
jgi:mannan endo-1,4-beta-mannosidase